MSNSKQAFWVLFGSLSAFVFSVVSSIVLSRYFSKADYGTYKQVLYVYNALLVVFTLGLPKAYSFFLPRLPMEEARSAISKINNILVASGIFMSIVIFFGAEIISSVLVNSDLAKPLKYFSLVPIFLLPTIGLEGILATYKNTKLLAVFNIIAKLLMLLCVVTPVVFFDGGVNSAIIGFTSASFLIFILAGLLKEQPIKKAKAKAIATKLSYKDVFDYSMPLFFAGFWGIIISTSDQFFISRYFGTEVFAEFANGSLELPFVSMIIAAASIVLAPIYSRKAFDNSATAKQEIIRLWHSVFSKTIKLTYPLIAFFFFFSTEVMVALYGQSYINSGDYFQVKLLVNFFTLIAYGPLVLSIGGNKYYYQVHMYGAIALVSLQALSVFLMGSAIAVVWVSVFCQIGRVAAMLLFVAKYFDLKLHQLFPWDVIAKILPCFIFLYGIKFISFNYFFIINPLIGLLIAGVIYILLFSIWAFVCKLNYWSIIKPLLNKVKST